MPTPISDDIDKALAEEIVDETPEKTEKDTPKDTTPEEDIEEPETETSEDDEEDEGGEDLEEEEETEEEPEAKAKQPSIITKLKKDFPGVHKKFPEVIDAFFLKKEYEEVFASPEAAKDAAEKADVMDEMLMGLSDGDMEPLMDRMYERDPDGLKSVITNFLPSVQRKSPEMFKQIIRPVIGNFLAAVARSAQASGNKDLLLATRYINQHISGKTGVPEPIEEKVVRRERETADADDSRAMKVFYSAVDAFVDPALDREINIGLDPDNSLPEGLRETAIEKIKEEIWMNLKANDSYMRTMSSMRKSAEAADFTKEWQKKVARAVVNSAKEIIPSIRARVKKKMFGNMLKKGATGEKNIPDSSSSNDTSPSKDNKTPAVDLKKHSIREEMDRLLPT